MRTFWTAATVTLALLGAQALAAAGTGPGAGDRAMRQLEVSVRSAEGWQKVGVLEFDATLRPRGLRLPGLPSGRLTVRLTHGGRTAAHVDSILLGTAAPIAVDGLEDPAAKKKVAAADLDVAAITGRSFTCSFAPSSERMLVVTARIEPPRGPEFPFAYPPANLYHRPEKFSSFYSYRLGSAPGKLAVDGELESETLGEPFFREFSRTGTGHPSADTWCWVKDDGKTLYAAIDFLPDNSFDGDADYSSLFVRTPTGIREFRVSVPLRKWGRSGFTYTSRARYQHKVYELAIPLAELGIDGSDGPKELELAFTAYGTAGPAQPIIDNFDEGDQTVSVATGAAAAGLGTCTAPCGIISGERDIQSIETTALGGTLQVSANQTVAGQLDFRSIGGGVGGTSIVWDGVDGDPVGNVLGLYCNVSDSYSMFEVVAANPGTGSATLQLRMWTDVTGTSFYESPPVLLGPGAAQTTLKLPWDTFTLVGTYGELLGIRAIELAVVGTTPGFDVQIDSITLTTGTTLPVVVDMCDEAGGDLFLAASGETGSTLDGAMWSGERDAWLRVDGSQGWLNRYNHQTDYYNESGAGRLVWDGNDDDYANLSFAGPPLDVSGRSVFALENLVMGQVALRARLYSSASACSEASVFVPDPTSSPIHRRLALPLCGFVPACASPVDLSAVRAIVLEMSNTSTGEIRFATVGFDDGPMPANPQSVTSTADGGAGSLREAVQYSCDGGTILFSLGWGSTIALSSPITIAHDVTITGPGSSWVTVSGGSTTRIFDVGNGSSVSISGLQLDDGWVSGGTGGAIRVDGASSLTVTSCTFVGNQAAEGGAIAILSGSTLNLANSTLSTNSAAAGSGGGLWNAGIAGVTNCTFYENVATGAGTGISNQSLAELHLRNTIIDGSSPETLCKNDGSLATTIANLVKDGSCGAILSGPALLAPLDTSDGNSVLHPLLPGSPAIDAGDDATCADPVVGNVDQRGIARPKLVHCDIGAFESQGFSLFGGSGYTQSTVVNTAFPQLLSLRIESPFFEPVDGGLITFAVPSSGASATIAQNPAIISGLGGKRAPEYYQGAVDATATANGIEGAYEVTASAAGLAAGATFYLTNTACTSAAVTVTSTDDSGAGTLRQAIQDVCADGTIDFALSYPATIVLASEIMITKGLAITGPGADQLAISGDNSTRVFRIMAPAGTVSISGVEITGGYVSMP
jgi:hypothetical protein